MHVEDTPAGAAGTGDRIGWGATLLGGIVGAAVGVGLHVALEVFAGVEAPWFAVITGLMTGIGVRQATKSHAHDVSYARGALTSIIALAAIVLSVPAIHRALDMKAEAIGKDGDKNKTATKQAASDAADDAAEDDAAEADPEPAKTADEAPAGTGPTGRIGAPKKAMGAQFKDVNWKQAAFMALGALIAYPLGRGSEASNRPEPVAMDPSN